MTREEHLQYCRICKNQVKDFNKGIICGITGTYADFDGTCSFYKEDAERKEIVESTVHEKQNIFSKASMGKRFANYLLDNLVMSIMIFIFAFVFSSVALIDNPAYYDDAEEGSIVLQYLLGFILTTIYYAIFEGLNGRSPAKYITKTKVVDLSGEKPDFTTIFIRTLCRFIPFDALSFLFSEETGWHDRISNTRVVNIEETAM